MTPPCVVYVAAGGPAGTFTGGNAPPMLNASYMVVDAGGACVPNLPGEYQVYIEPADTLAAVRARVEAGLTDWLGANTGLAPGDLSFVWLG